VGNMACWGKTEDWGRGGLEIHLFVGTEKGGIKKGKKKGLDWTKKKRSHSTKKKTKKTTPRLRKVRGKNGGRGKNLSELRVSPEARHFQKSEVKSGEAFGWGLCDIKSGVIIKKNGTTSR